MSRSCFRRRLGDEDGFDLISHTRNNHPDSAVLVVTGYATPDTAVEAVRAGAFDLLTKPMIDDELNLAISRAVSQRDITLENEKLRKRLDSRSGLENMVAAGLVMTGGASKIEGAEELAEEIFHMPVRLAKPQYVSGLSDVVSNAIHATGVGLLLYGSRADASTTKLTVGGGESFFDRVRSWFRGEF